MSGTALLLMSFDETRERTAAALREWRIDVRVAGGIEDVPGGEPWPDVAVVEPALARVDGCELCAGLREAGLPGLIALGSRTGGAEAAELLRAGADDFVRYPIGAAELVARVRALLRRLREYCARPAAVMELGDVIVHFDRREVTVRGRTVTLTPKEFELLRELARGSGEPVERDELLARVWGYDGAVSSRTLDVHVGRLRRKIERDPSHPRLIVTVPRVGYRIAA